MLIPDPPFQDWHTHSPSLAKEGSCPTPLLPAKGTLHLMSGPGGRINAWPPCLRQGSSENPPQLQSSPRFHLKPWNSLILVLPSLASPIHSYCFPSAPPSLHPRLLTCKFQIQTVSQRKWLLILEVVLGSKQKCSFRVGSPAKCLAMKTRSVVSVEYQRPLTCNYGAMLRFLLVVSWNGIWEEESELMGAVYQVSEGLRDELDGYCWDYPLDDYYWRKRTKGLRVINWQQRVNSPMWSLRETRQIPEDDSGLL